MKEIFEFPCESSQDSVSREPDSIKKFDSGKSTYSVSDTFALFWIGTIEGTPNLTSHGREGWRCISPSQQVLFSAFLLD